MALTIATERFENVLCNAMPSLKRTGSNIQMAAKISFGKPMNPVLNLFIPLGNLQTRGKKKMKLIFFLNNLECLEKMTEEYTEIVKEVAKFAASIHATTTCPNPSDGRLESAIQESGFLEMLKSKCLETYPHWKIVLSPPRASCDLMINSIRINLKISKCQSSDNSVSKGAIFYSITGLTDYPTFSDWNLFWCRLEKAKDNALIKLRRDRASEYHYLVKNKISGEVLFKSIFDISQYIANPSNSLQIHWGNEFKNIDHYTKDEEYLAKVQSLLLCLQKSVREMISKTQQFATAEIGTLFSGRSKQKQLGQYFTTSNQLQETVFKLVRFRNHPLLEPSFGAGHLLRKFLEANPEYPMTCFEIDREIEPVVRWDSRNQTVIYEDFLKTTVEQLPHPFKTIVANPPYVKSASGKNLYLRFIEKCFELLSEEGEMILIVPSDFLKMTHASKLIQRMLQYGGFSDFYFPHDESLFKGANIDVVVFRYERSRMLMVEPRKTWVNGREVYFQNNKGIITFKDEPSENFKDFCIESKFAVYVGMVSGKDEIYRVPFGNIEVLVDKDRVEKFIFLESFPSENEQINEYLGAKKSLLLERKIRKFSESNWYQWGAPRNLSNIRRYWGQTCVYVNTVTRRKEVAFLGRVQYFGGSLLCVIPRQGGAVNLCSKVVEYLNSPEFQSNYIYSNRFKIGHRQLCSAIIPEKK